jgi:hypothetical protein
VATQLALTWRGEGTGSHCGFRCCLFRRLLVRFPHLGRRGLLLISRNEGMDLDLRIRIVGCLFGGRRG